MDSLDASKPAGSPDFTVGGRSVWAIKSVDGEKGEATGRLPGLKRRACQWSDNTVRIVRGF